MESYQQSGIVGVVSNEKIQEGDIVGVDPNTHLTVAEIHFGFKYWDVRGVVQYTFSEEFLQGPPRLNCVGGYLVVYGLIKTTVGSFINQALVVNLLRYKTHWDNPEVCDSDQYTEEQGKDVTTVRLFGNITTEKGGVL